MPRNLSRQDRRKRSPEEFEDRLAALSVEGLARVLPGNRDLSLKRDVAAVYAVVHPVDRDAIWTLLHQGPEIRVLAPVVWEQAGMKVQTSDARCLDLLGPDDVWPPGQDEHVDLCGFYSGEFLRPETRSQGKHIKMRCL